MRYSVLGSVEDQPEKIATFGLHAPVKMRPLGDRQMKPGQKRVQCLDEALHPWVVTSHDGKGDRHLAARGFDVPPALAKSGGLCSRSQAYVLPRAASVG